MAPAATRRADIGRPDLAATRPSRPGRRRTDGAPRMIVVTGGAGFIGSNLLAALEERGERDLVVCDRLGGAGKWRNVAKRELADIVATAALFPFLDRSEERRVGTEG